MDKVTSPSQKLAARLAAKQVESPRLQRDAAHFIRLAEAQFENPTASVTITWTKHYAGDITYSRQAHQFSDYESFVFKLTSIMLGLGQANPELAHELMASAVYASGKAMIDNREGTLRESIFEYMNGLRKDNGASLLPAPLDAFAPQVHELIGYQNNLTTPPELKEWIRRHVGGPPKEEATPSPIFSNENSGLALPLGIDPATGRQLYYKGEASLLTIAAPGKGKTQCHVLPALAGYRGPAIVLDIKGECFRLTADWRRQNVGPVIVFNPLSPEESASYNPLAFVSDQPEELWQDARFLADLLIVSRGGSHDPVWENQGKDLLTLFIAFTVWIHEPVSRQMNNILDLIAGINQAAMFEFVMNTNNKAPTAMVRAASRFSQMSRTAPKQFEGVLSAVSQHLQIWEGPKVESVTSRLDWKPDNFRQAPYPTLYLCIPPSAIDTYAPLLRVIVAQHVRQLMKHEKRPSAPILFLLDELPRLGHMEPIRQALEVGRSYGIKLWMIAQYPEQLIHAYPGVGEGMMESCEVRMYMNPSPPAAERLSKAFGRSRTIFGEKAPIIEAADILGPAHRESIFVLAANENPRILAKRYFHNS